MASSQIISARQKWLESDNIFKDAFNTKIDNHADKHCFGKNFRPLSWSDLMCSVSPFLSEYTAIDNVEICTAATAWTTHTGQLYILIFGQGLCFGERMDISLINPNQCRSYGISPCGDPKEPHRTLGFQRNTLNIPLFVEGTIATMSTRCPSLEEIESCQYIYLSEQESWDLSNVNFNILEIVMSKIEREDILCLDSSSIDIILKFTFGGSQLSWSER